MPTVSELDRPEADDSTSLDGAVTPPRIVSLRENLPDNSGLTQEEKRLLLSQARLLIEHVYVHLYLKRSLYGVDPVQRLKLLQYRLEDQQDEVVTSELAFHRELQAIFNGMHDLHTNYILPLPYREITGFLPFLLEEYFDENKQSHYIVSKLLAGYTHDTFKPGVEVTLWNGMPIQEAIRINGEREAGSNHAARYSVGLGSLTIRPMATSLPPNEVLVRLTYLSDSADNSTIEFEWMTFARQPASSNADHAIETPEAHAGDMEGHLKRLSLMATHLQTEKINECRKILFAPGAWKAEQQQDLTRLFSVGDEDVETSLPAVIRAKPVKTPDGEFAYIRIFTFVAPDADAFIEEMIRLLRELPQNGLILDVRGNSGGLINMAERLLQLLTPDYIEPEKAQFIANAFTREMCKYNSPSPIAPTLDLSPWVPSLDQARTSGSLYSTAHSLTSEDEANDLGQVYSGPVVLITDAQCYSATDMFAAGFQDHKIGKVLGVDNNTGAGGANVWTHFLLRILDMPPEVSANSGVGKLEELPRNADFRVSARRMLRAIDNAGMPLEDYGVKPDERHYMTRRDLLEGNIDLINQAGKLLTTEKPHRMNTALVKDGNICKLRVTTKNVERLDWYFDGRPGGSEDVKDGDTDIRIVKAMMGKHAYLEGFADGKKVVSQAVELNCPE